MDAEIRRVFSKLPQRRRERSSSLGFVLFTFCSAFWLLMLVAVVGSPLWLSLLAAVANGIAIAMLFIVGHDAGHGSLVPALWVNRTIGTIALLPSLHPFSAWKRCHNGRHHSWTNLKGEDPGYPPFSLEEFRRLSQPRRLLERFYRSVAGLGFFYFFEIYWKCMLFPSRGDQQHKKDEFLLDRTLVALFLTAEIVGIYWISFSSGRAYPLLFTLYAVISPYAVFVWIMAFVTYQHHTNAEIPWFDQKDEWSYFQNQVAGTTHVTFPRFFQMFFLNIMEHTAHHVDPLIPLYNLKESQAALEVAYPASVQIIAWSPSVLWNTLKCCKLYDYREHRWLDFNGRPTTPPLLMMIEPSEVVKGSQIETGQKMAADAQFLADERGATSLAN